jgi:hypothetical protein
MSEFNPEQRVTTASTTPKPAIKMPARRPGWPVRSPIGGSEHEEHHEGDGVERRSAR